MGNENKLPESWQVLPFVEAIDFQEGPGILAKDFHKTGVPLIRLSGLDNGTSVLHGCNYLDPKLVDKRYPHFRIKEGDILLSTSASLGRTAVVTKQAEGAIVYTGIIRMRPRGDNLYAPFIKYLLESPNFQNQVEAMGVGSVLRHFGPYHLKQMKVIIPPLTEQRAIAGMLGALDNKIEINRHINATLESMALAMFHSWFVNFDPVRVRAEDRQPLMMDVATAALFPDGFEDSIWGKIPKDWKIGVLTAIASVVMGASPPGDTYNEIGNGVPLVNGPTEFGDYFTLKKKWTSAPTRLSQVGDLVFCVRGSTTGRRVVADDHYCLGRGVCAIRAKIKDTQPFVDQTINFGIDRLLAKTTGSVFPNLSSLDIGQFDILIPPQQIIKAYCQSVWPLIRRIEHNVKESDTLGSLRDSLLPKLMRGEVRVSAL